MGTSRIGRPDSEANRRHRPGYLHTFCSTSNGHYTRIFGRARQPGANVGRRLYRAISERPQPQPCVAPCVSGIISFRLASSERIYRQRIAHAARVQDITKRDLVTPEPERTRNILSAIINFIKFAEERGTFLKNLRDQSTSALEERDAMVQQAAELREKVEEIK